MRSVRTWTGADPRLQATFAVSEPRGLNKERKSTPTYYKMVAYGVHQPHLNEDIKEATGAVWLKRMTSDNRAAQRHTGLSDRGTSRQVIRIQLRPLLLSSIQGKANEMLQMSKLRTQSHQMQPYHQMPNMWEGTPNH